MDSVSNVNCNLYKVLRGKDGNRLGTGGVEGIGAIKKAHPHLNKDSTLITRAGDWGIKCSEKLNGITGEMQYYYRIEDATHGGVFLPLEIKSICQGVKRWYSTNLYQYLGENVYPLPLNVRLPDSTTSPYIKAKDNNPKERLCCANFSMTCPYRIRVAEWASLQDIDCYFPERYAGQGEELNMQCLQQSPLSQLQYLSELAGHKFCICPIGNGLDTFRTWESILVNTVPIVQDSWMSRVFAKIWPMIIVNRYEQSNIPLLMDDFIEKHGVTMDYDSSLLEEDNFENLLDRIQYEGDRLRRQ
tara:strand:+ start:8005 stop:8907 length:903 start_codon:yes stop_codon:yes gene_type:complete